MVVFGVFTKCFKFTAVIYFTEMAPFSAFTTLDVRLRFPWHTLQLYIVPGVGPGLDSIPALSNSIWTRQAGVEWPIVKKVAVHKRWIEQLLGVGEE